MYRSSLLSILTLTLSQIITGTLWTSCALHGRQRVYHICLSPPPPFPSTPLLTWLITEYEYSVQKKNNVAFDNTLGSHQFPSPSHKEDHTLD